MPRSFNERTSAKPAACRGCCGVDGGRDTLAHFLPVAALVQAQGVGPPHALGVGAASFRGVEGLEAIDEQEMGVGVAALVGVDRRHPERLAVAGEVGEDGRAHGPLLVQCGVAGQRDDEFVSEADAVGVGVPLRCAPRWRTWRRLSGQRASRPGWHRLTWR